MGSDFQDRLNQKAAERRQQELAARKQQEEKAQVDAAQQAKKAAADQKAAEELLCYGKETFEGAELPVSKSTLQVRWEQNNHPDTVRIVTEFVGADVMGTVPLFTVQCDGGIYRLWKGMDQSRYPSVFHTRGELKQHIEKSILDMDAQEWKGLLEQYSEAHSQRTGRRLGRY